MSNFFDQFDTQETPGNFFDQFDEAPAGMPEEPTFNEEMVEEGRYTFDGLVNDQELLTAARRYYGLGQGVTDDEVVEEFISDRRWKDSNTLSIAQEAYSAATGNEAQNQDQALLIERWAGLPGIFSEGGEGFGGLWANLWRGTLDPANLIGFGLASTAAKTAARTGVKSAVGRAAGAIASRPLTTTVVADAGVTAGANALTQSAQMDVGLRDEFSVGETAMAGAMGAGLSVAGAGAGVAAGKGIRAVRDATINRGRTALPNSPTADKVAGRFETPVSEEAVGNSYRAFVPDQTGNLVDYTDAQGNVVTFRSSADAKAAVQGVANAQVMNVDQTGSVHELGGWLNRKANNLTNNFIDSTNAIEKLSRTAEPFVKGTNLEQFNAHMFTVNSQNAHMLSSMAVSGHLFEDGTNAGGMFRFVGDQAIAKELGLDWKANQGKFVLLDNSKSLREILTPIYEQNPELVNRLGQHMLFRRLLDKEQAGNAKALHGFDRVELQQAVNDYASQMPDIFDPNTAGSAIQQLDAYNRNFMSLMADMGIYNRDELATVLDSNLFYMPLYELIDAMDGTGATGSMGNLKRYFRGNERADTKLANPLRIYAMNVEAAITRAVENRRVNFITDTIETMRQRAPAIADLYGRPVKSEAVPSTFSKEALMKRLDATLKDAGVPAVDRQNFIQDLDAVQGLEFITFWSQGKFRPKPSKTDGTVVSYYKDGSLQYYEFNDTNLAKSVTSFSGLVDAMQQQQFGGVPNAFGHMAHMFQYMVTRDPEFWAFTSFLTDPVTASVYDGTNRTLGYLPFVDAYQKFAQGWKEMKLTSSTYKEAVANGVLYTGLASHKEQNRAVGQWLRRKGIDPDYVLGLSAEQDKRLTQLMAEKLYTGADWFMGKADYMPNAIEGAPRMAQLERRLQTGSGNYATAAYQAIQDNIDFRRRGASQGYQLYARTVPFLNAMQNVFYRYAKSWDGVGRAIVSRGKRGSKENLRRQAQIFSQVTLPIVGLTLANLYGSESERYQQLNADDRRMFWHVFLPGDVHLRLRKSDELAMFGSFIEDTLVRMERDNEGMGEAVLDAFLEGSASTFGIFRTTDPHDFIAQFLPIGAGGAWDMLVNNSFGSGPLMPPALEDMPVTQQYLEGSTSNVAIELGEVMGVAPVYVEHTLREFLGPAAKYLGYTSNIGDERRKVVFDPAGSPSLDNFIDWPVVRKYLLTTDEPLRTTYHINRVYELMEDAEKSEGLFQALKRGRTEVTGEIEQTAAYDDDFQRQQSALLLLQDATQKMAELRKALRVNYNNTALEKEKRIENERRMRAMLHTMAAVTVGSVEHILKGKDSVSE